MKTKNKILVGIVAVCMITAMGLATADLLDLFGSVKTTANVMQSVQIDGHNFNEPVYEEFDAIGGCCYCTEHEVTNYGCEGIWLDWEHEGLPDLEGIDILFTEKGAPQECLEHLDISVLDGMAEYDDFTVYVDGTLVYTYYADGGEETWITHTIDLTPWQIPCDGTHTVKIDCIAQEPWEYWETYGQLGVDTIELYCGCPCDPTYCDGVDIGMPDSETGHNLIGWGPIEPATSGGNWGGIDDCRATWAPDEDQEPTTWASVDLTCDVPEPGDCDCENDAMDTPFYLEPGQTIYFCLCYKFDMLILPGTYHIQSMLVPVIPE